MEQNMSTDRKSDNTTGPPIILARPKASSLITNDVDLPVCNETDEKLEPETSMSPHESSNKANLDSSIASLVCYDTSSESEDEADLSSTAQVVEGKNENIQDKSYACVNTDPDSPSTLNQANEHQNIDSIDQHLGSTSTSNNCSFMSSTQLESDKLESLPHSCDSISEDILPVKCVDEDVSNDSSMDATETACELSSQDDATNADEREAMQIPQDSINGEVTVLTDYRTREIISISSESEAESWTSDSEADSDYSSSDVSESPTEKEKDDESSVSQEKTDSLSHLPDCQENKKMKNKKNINPFDEIDLPPIEDLQISVKESEAKAIGCITQIVDTQVVVEAYPDIPTIDLDSVLFLDGGQRCLGRVFDVFGLIQEPLYVVRFNSSEHIKEQGVEKGAQVFFAPRTEHTSYVMITELLSMRGSDASWKENKEPPEELLDYSDDEQERMAKRARKLRKKENEPVVIGEFESGRKKVRAERRNPFSSITTPSHYMASSNSSTPFHRNSSTFGKCQRGENWQEQKPHRFWNRSQGHRFGDPGTFRSPLSPFPMRSPSQFQYSSNTNRDFHTNTPPLRPHFNSGDSSVNKNQFRNNPSPLPNLQTPPPSHMGPKQNCFSQPLPINSPNMQTPPPTFTQNFPPATMQASPHAFSRPLHSSIPQTHPPFTGGQPVMLNRPPHLQSTSPLIQAPPPHTQPSPPVMNIPPPYIPSSPLPHTTPPPNSYGPPLHNQVGNQDSNGSVQRLPTHPPPIIQNNGPPSYIQHIPPPTVNRMPPPKFQNETSVANSTLPPFTKPNLPSVFQGPPPPHSPVAHNGPPPNVNHFRAPPPLHTPQHQTFSSLSSTSQPFHSTQPPLFSQPPPIPNFAVPPPQPEHSPRSFHAPPF